MINKNVRSNFADKNWRRSIVATLLSVEAIIVFALGGFLLVKSLTSDVQALSAVIGVILFSLLGGLGLIGAAQEFRRARNYGRAPAVLANGIALGVAYFQLQAHLWVSGVGLALLAGITFALALSILPDSPPFTAKK